MRTRWNSQSLFGIIIEFVKELRDGTLGKMPECQDGHFDVP
jgi:hypothetical protein